MPGQRGIWRIFRRQALAAALASLAVAVGVVTAGLAQTYFLRRPTAGLEGGPITIPEPSDSAGLEDLPAGAVLLFDSACPSGWAELTAMAGRAPVGAGAYGETYSASGGRSWSFSHTYTLGETGGYATWQLNNSEMPNHNHGGARTTFGSGSSSNAVISGTPNISTGTDFAGGSGAHENRPPFFVRLFCEKTA